MAFEELLRERIIERVDPFDEVNKTPALVLSNICPEITTVDDGKLNEKEFKVLFALLDLNYSDHKFNHLYKVIISGKDRSMSQIQLYEKLIPEINDLEKASKLLCRILVYVTPFVAIISIVIFALIHILTVKPQRNFIDHDVGFGNIA